MYNFMLQGKLIVIVSSFNLFLSQHILNNKKVGHINFLIKITILIKKVVILQIN